MVRLVERRSLEAPAEFAKRMQRAKHEKRVQRAEKRTQAKAPASIGTGATCLPVLKHIKEKKPITVKKNSKTKQYKRNKI